MIEFIRGDTKPFRFRIKNVNGQPIQKSEVDTLIMTCRKRDSEKSPILFEKTIDDFIFGEDGFCHSQIKPEDTQNLEYGAYGFDIECTLLNGYRKTLKANFKITEEDTIHLTQSEV